MDSIKNKPQKLIKGMQHTHKKKRQNRDEDTDGKRRWLRNRKRRGDACWRVDEIVNFQIAQKKEKRTHILNYAILFSTNVWFR